MSEIIQSDFYEIAILDPRWHQADLGGGGGTLTFQNGGITMGTGTTFDAGGFTLSMDNTPVIIGPGLTIDFKLGVQTNFWFNLEFGIYSAGDVQHLLFQRTDTASIGQIVCSTKGLPILSTTNTNAFDNTNTKTYRIQYENSSTVNYFITDVAGDFENVATHLVGDNNGSVGHVYITWQNASGHNTNKDLFLDQVKITTP